ncbi:MAG: potassium/proton antiporter [Faecalimonas sp.]|nr:potassium/proton antiporter [Faecalimonas sp.]
MASLLLLVAIVIFACIALNKISSKLGIPMLLAFILLGMFFGSDGVVKIPFDNYSFAEQICSVALIFIMFYGGFGTNWKEAKPVAAKSILLSTLGVVLTAGLVGLFCYFVLGFSLLESFLIGSVISSTDAASVFSILRSKRLSLKYRTASMLELESGSNDPFSYMLTMIFITLIRGKVSGVGFGYMIFAQIVYGLICGLLFAYAAAYLLRRIQFATEGFEIIFTVGVAIFAYALPTVIGGNGYLSTYIVGIVLGNVQIKHKKRLVHFFDGITGLMQMLIFFLLGLLSFPSKLPQIAIPAFCIALFLTFVARPLAVSLLLTPFRSKLSQQAMVSWSGLRGAASIVFAIMAVMQTDTKTDIFHIVFFIVLFSILLQGSLISIVAGKLNMIDEDTDVMKTFTDYSNEVPVQFIQFTLPSGHKWCERELRNVTLPPDTLAALLIRDGKNVVPNGKTVLQVGDKLILSAKTPETENGVLLSEIQVEKEDSYVGKRLSDIPQKKNTLVIMIQRKERVIIPRGNVVLREGDVLVIHHTDGALGHKKQKK